MNMTAKTLCLMDRSFLPFASSASRKPEIERVSRKHLAAIWPHAQAQVVLVDVRNGYIYGFAASVPDAATFAGHDKAKTAVMELAEETGIMLRDLRIELAEARLDRVQ